MKKKYIYLTIILISILSVFPVHAANAYCSGLKSTFMFIGEIVRLAKIVVPIIIIGLGMLDLFKAVTGGKDGEIGKSFKSLVMRLIAGVCIFFLPTVIELVFSWVDGWSDNYESGYSECAKCILNVNDCK